MKMKMKNTSHRYDINRFLDFSSRYKIIFHNFGACIVILYSLFVSLKEGTLYISRKTGWVMMRRP